MVLINPEKPGKMREYRDARRFARAVEQIPGARVVVMIQVRNQIAADRTTDWVDLVEFWSGPWSRDIPRPTTNDLIAAGRTAGARYVRAVTRTIV